MSDPSDDIAAIEKRIKSAYAALRGARAVHEHSPNGETCAVEEMAEATLNGLLDRWREVRQAESIVTA